MSLLQTDNARASAPEKISAALVDMLGKKPYREISVSELAAASGLSRQAFYMYFRDKDDVLDRIFLRLFGDIMTAVSGSGAVTVEELVRVYTDIVEKYSGVLTVFADNNLGPVLSRVFVGELVNNAPVLQIQKEPESEEERLIINSFWVSAFTDAYTVWLRNGMKTPKSDLNKILTDIMTGVYFTK